MAIIEYPTEDSMLDGLLETAINKWNVDGKQITREQIVSNMDKIAFHESKNISDAIQKSDKTESGIGPGRGLFQFEVGEGQGADTAATRLIKQLGYTPSFLEGFAESNYDVSSLTPKQQQALFMGNLLRMPDKEAGEGRVAANFADVDTNEELADYWAQYHHAGTTLGSDEEDVMVNKFLKDLQDY